MNELDKEAFEKTYHSMKAPADLKADTLEKMLEADRLQKQDADAKRNGLWRGSFFRYAAFPAVILVVFFCFFIGKPARASYITPMEEGVYYDEVELKDGVIHFVKNRVAISVTPNAGAVVIGQETTENEPAQTTVEEVDTESGGRILFGERAAVSLPDIGEDNWSYIGDQKIYVTVLQAESARYQAVFEKEETVYEMTGEGVTQKEFIDELYKRVKSQ